MYVKDYLKGLNLKERLLEVKDIDTLNRVEVDFITLEFKTLLATTLDDYEGLNITQKTWLFAAIVNQFYEGANAFIGAFFQRRAQEIANSSRIIKV